MPTSKVSSLVLAITDDIRERNYENPNEFGEGLVTAFILMVLIYMGWKFLQFLAEYAKWFREDRATGGPEKRRAAEANQRAETDARRREEARRRTLPELDEAKMDMIELAGVTVISADAGEGPVALTASSVSSVSAEPPVLTFAISGRTSSATTLTTATSLVVHLLGADQLDLAVRCATPGTDRFADPTWWERLPTGEPAFVGSRVRLVGDVIDRRVYGDSTVIALQVRSTEIAPDAQRREPLAYHDRTWHRLGAGSRFA